MAAVLWLSRLAFVTLNVLLGFVFVMTNTDFYGSVFEKQVVSKHLHAKENFLFFSMFVSVVGNAASNFALFIIPLIILEIYFVNGKNLSYRK